MWEIEYRAEERMVKMVRELPWQTSEAVAEHLARAGRELLLLQASDWPFVVHSYGAVDYGIQRFSGHATQFHRAVDMAEDAAKGKELSEVQKVEIADMDLHDGVFGEIELGWWQ